jgi:hypothetical protein
MTVGAAAATLTKLFGSGSFTDSSNVPFGGRAGVVAKLIQLFGMLDATKLLEAGKQAAFTGGKAGGEAKP